MRTESLEHGYMTFISNGQKGHEMQKIEPTTVTYSDYAYGQGLAYAWGRIDAGDRRMSGWEMSFAEHWREVSRQPSRPSIQRAFEIWQNGEDK